MFYQGTKFSGTFQKAAQSCYQLSDTFMASPFLFHSFQFLPPPHTEIIPPSKNLPASP